MKTPITKKTGLCAFLVSALILAGGCSGGSGQQTTPAAPAETTTTTATSAAATVQTTTSASTSASAATAAPETTTAAQTSEPEPETPATVTIAGMEYSTDYTMISLSGQHLTDEELASLSQFSGLTKLSLPFCDIDDISFLSGMTQLTELDLSYNNITDISVLGELKNLEKLNIYGNNYTDISVLYGLDKLESASVGNIYVPYSQTAYLDDLIKGIDRSYETPDFIASLPGTGMDVRGCEKKSILPTEDLESLPFRDKVNEIVDYINSSHSELLDMGIGAESVAFHEALLYDFDLDGREEAIVSLYYLCRFSQDDPLTEWRTDTVWYIDDDGESYELTHMGLASDYILDFGNTIWFTVFNDPNYGGGTLWLRARDGEAPGSLFGYKNYCYYDDRYGFVCVSAHIMMGQYYLVVASDGSVKYIGQDDLTLDEFRECCEKDSALNRSLEKLGTDISKVKEVYTLGYLTYCVKVEENDNESWHTLYDGDLMTGPSTPMIGYPGYYDEEDESVEAVHGINLRKLNIIE